MKQYDMWLLAIFAALCYIAAALDNIVELLEKVQ